MHIFKKLLNAWVLNLWLCFFIASFVFSTAGQEKLVLIGGGERPKEAIAKFVEWAGGKQAKILIITWASGVPQESFESIKEDFAGFPVSSFELAPIAPLDAESRLRFLSQLKSATGIFFTGGDQNRVMDILKDETLYNALRERYQAGIVFGGTSAGTAIMSTPMITGEADLTVINGAKVETRRGLGLIPNLIVDQHFIKRQRENRLFGLILQNPQMLGIGIDEDTALLIENNRFAEVVGATQVMFIDAQKKKGAMIIYLLKAKEHFDLVKRKP